MKRSPISMDIRRMALGNTDALAQFYRATATAAYGLALSMLRNPDAAADALHEAYLTAYETAAGYSPKESALVWLLSLVYHQCSTQKAPAVEDIPSDFSPVAALSCVAHLTPKEIAKITGLSRKEILPFKHFTEDADLAAFCQSISEKTPDLSQSIIISALLSGGRPPVTQPQNVSMPIPKPFRWKWLAYALPALAVLVLVGFIYHNLTNHPIAATIYLDGETGIYLELDKNDRVLAAGACNDAGEPLLQGLRLRNFSVDAAMEKIVDAMISSGSLKELPDALLLSVSPAPSGEESDDTLQKY